MRGVTATSAAHAHPWTPTANRRGPSVRLTDAHWPSSGERLERAGDLLVARPKPRGLLLHEPVGPK